MRLCRDEAFDQPPSMELLKAVTVLRTQEIRSILTAQGFIYVPRNQHFTEIIAIL